MGNLGQPHGLHLPSLFNFLPPPPQIPALESQSAHLISQSISQYAHAPSTLRCSHSPTAESRHQLCGQPSYHQLNRPPASLSTVVTSALQVASHTIIKPSPPSSNSHALAICRIPAGSGFGGLNSRVTMGANVFPGRKVCSKCITGPLITP